jgi:hypothetical protein
MGGLVRMDVNEFSRTQAVQQALERHASLGAAGLYFVATRAFSSSVQFSTTTNVGAPAGV